MADNEDETVSLSRAALDLLIADLDRSRRVGWARAYSAEQKLAQASAEPMPPVSVDAPEELTRSEALDQIDRGTQVITRWFKPLWYSAAWSAGHQQLIQIGAADLEWARANWSDRTPGQSGYIDGDGRQLVSNAPRPRNWIWTVIDLLRAGVAEEVIEESVHAAMTLCEDPAEMWSLFMSEVESRW